MTDPRTPTTPTEGSHKAAVAASGSVESRPALAPGHERSNAPSTQLSSVHLPFRPHIGGSLGEDVVKNFFRRASTSVKGTLPSSSQKSRRPPSSSAAGSSSDTHRVPLPWKKLGFLRNRPSSSYNAESPDLSTKQHMAESAGASNIVNDLPAPGGSVTSSHSTTDSTRAQNGSELVEQSRSLKQLKAEDAGGDGESAVDLCASSSANSGGPKCIDIIKMVPVELACQILSHLDHHGLASAERVSKLWSAICKESQIWRNAFEREKSTTFAMGKPVKPGTGMGLPLGCPNKHFKDVYKARQHLEKNWRKGISNPIYLHGHSDSIYCLQFDEDKIISGSRDKTIRVWDVRQFVCKLVIGPAHVVDATETMLTEDRRPVHYASLENGHLTSVVVPLSLKFDMCHNASILCLQYDDEILVTGSSDSTCIIHDMKNNYKPIMQLRQHTAAVLDLAFDDKHIVTCSKDTTIGVWDRKTGEFLKSLLGHNGPVNAVQLRGNTIVSCSGDFKVKLWNIDTGKNIREFIGHTKGLACSQFSEDGKYIASAGNDKIIRIWDANTGECLRQMEAHENLVRSLHIDSVSGRLVSASYDQDIKVFDMKDGRQLLDFPKWHSSWVLGAKSDYRRLISTGQDPKILIMDFGKGVKGIELLESGSSVAP